MHIFYIVNPNAGGGKGLKVWNRTRAYMDRRGIEYDILFTATQGDAAMFAKELSESAGEDSSFNLVVIGGDGTLNEVLNGLKHISRIKVGYIPAGSGEDFARSLRISHDPRKTVDVLSGRKAGRIDAMDYGVMTCENGEVIRRFANSSGIGFDAAVCSGMNRKLAQNGRFPVSKKLMYITEGIREFLFCKPSSGYILLDEKRRVEFNNLLFVSAHIHPYEGGGFRFGNYADPKDGLLEICAFSSRNRLKLIPMLLRSRFRGLGSSGRVKLYQCSEARIHFDKPSEVHTDGESLGLQRDIHVRCVNRQLNIFRRG